MSKKPTLTIRYPEASEKALKLTEAMVKRSPGKRVVETESEDPIFPDGGDLFSSFIRCKTSTGVDLTLTLNPSSMDYALETLIRPNLNADERKQILGEDPASSEEALPGLAPTDDPTKEQKKQIEVGKLTDVDLRIILHDLIDCTQGYVSGGPDAYDEHIDSAIENAIKEIDHKAGEKKQEDKDSVPSLEKPGEKEQEYILREDITLTARFASLLTQIASTPKKGNVDHGFVPIVEDMIAYIDSIDTAGNKQPIVTMMLLKRLLILASGAIKNTPRNKRPDYYTLADELAQIVNNEITQEPSWDDVEKEAQTIGQKEPQAPAQQSAAPLAEEPSAPAEKSAAPRADGDIEPGLLNDLETETEEKTDE